MFINNLTFIDVFIIKILIKVDTNMSECRVGLAVF